MSEAPNSKAKILGTTGVICALGGYICGDKIDEHDKRVQEEQPYEIAKGLMEDAVEKEQEWMEKIKNANSIISSYEITIDSLKRITNQLYQCQNQYADLQDDKRSCIKEKEALTQKINQYSIAYQNEKTELSIRDNQIDSLESLAKKYINENNKLQDEYAVRSPIEYEFQAIHNCINAHGQDMSEYQYLSQAKCCIKAVKSIQKEYPNDKLKNITPRCND